MFRTVWLYIQHRITARREYQKFAQELQQEEDTRYADEEYFTGMRYGKHRRKTDG